MFHLALYEYSPRELYLLYYHLPWMIPSRCVVPGCSSDSRVPGHVFPKNQQLADKWQHIIRSPVIEELTNEERRRYKVCGLHFPDEAYIFSLRRRKLKYDAVPTLELIKNEQDNLI